MLTVLLRDRNVDKIISICTTAIGKSVKAKICVNDTIIQIVWNQIIGSLNAFNLLLHIQMLIKRRVSIVQSNILIPIPTKVNRVFILIIMRLDIEIEWNWRYRKCETFIPSYLRPRVSRWIESVVQYRPQIDNSWSQYEYTHNNIRSN